MRHEITQSFSYDTATSNTIDNASMFCNPIGEGADPFVIQDPTRPERYLWCMSEGNRAIALHTSSRLTSLGPKHVVWRAPDVGPYSREVWAPELHFLNDKWYIYFAASDGSNDSHLTYVLESKGKDPLGKYKLHGPLATGDGNDGRSPNVWAIDMTVLQHHSNLYAIWSGWDAPGTDRQFLYIARLKTPTEIVPPRVCLCANDDYMWERIKPKKRERGLHEGPQVFQGDNGKTCIVYSCGASWRTTYKLGLLELVGDNPLDASSWKKHDTPVFHGNGAGHSCFVNSLDGEELWHVYHAKWDDKPGWKRAIYIQPMRESDDGLPIFGSQVEPGRELERPSGERFSAVRLPYRESFMNEQKPLSDWSYYGHHQFMSLFGQRLHLGVVPDEPINDFQSGEKLILDRHVPQDYSVEVTIDFGGDTSANEAGILFRCSGMSLGNNSQHGYYAGLFPQKQAVALGKTNGKDWKELGIEQTEISFDTRHRLQVRVSGACFTVFHNGRKRLTVVDDSYSDGFVGLRVGHTHAMFSNLVIDLLGGDKLVV